MSTLTESNKKMCFCAHTYQDKKYEKGIRVHSPLAKKTNQLQQWRCSVCERVRT